MYPIRTPIAPESRRIWKPSVAVRRTKTSFQSSGRKDDNSPGTWRQVRLTFLTEPAAALDDPGDEFIRVEFAARSTQRFWKPVPFSTWRQHHTAAAILGLR